MHSRTQQNGSQVKVGLKLLDVFRDFDNFVDMNGSIYR